MKKTLKGITFGIAAIMASFLPCISTHAESKTATVTASIAESLSLTLSAGSMDFNLETNDLYTDFINVIGRTNSANGYTISFNANNDYNDLKHSNALIEDKIASIEGPRTESEFPNKSWGYSIDDSNYTFKKVPLNPKNIFTTSTQGETTHKFTTGVKGSADLVAGDYENELLFTIIANPLVNNTDDDDDGDNSENPEPLTYDEYGRAKAILGVNGNLNFVFDSNTYNIGESYTDNLGATEIVAVYNVPLNASIINWSPNTPWSGDIENVTSVNFSDSFYDFHPTKTSGWFKNGNNITSLTNPQNLNTSETWSMSHMFAGTKIALLDLHAWDTKKVTNINYMFQGMYPENSFALNVSGWDTSRLATANSAFGNAGATWGIGSWEISGIEDWDVSNLKKAREMFLGAGWYAPNFSLNLSNWDVSNIRDAYGMFQQTAQDAANVNINLSYWGLDRATDMYHFMNSFAMNSNKATINMDNFSANAVTNLDSAFYNIAGGSNNRSDNELNFNMKNFHANSLQSAQWMLSHMGERMQTANIDVSGWNLSNTANLSSAFYYAGHDSSAFTMNAKNMKLENANISNMFDSLGYQAADFSLDVTGWDLGESTNANHLFYYMGYNALTSWKLVGIEDWDVSNIEDMSNMFSYVGANANEINLDLHKWNTESVTNVSSMFNSLGYYNAKTIKLNLSGFNFSNVSDLNNMFGGSVGNNAETLSMNLSNWNLGNNITSLSNLFSSVGEKAGDVTINVSGWDTSNITNMRSTFNWTAQHADSFNLVGINDWDVSNADRESMFNDTGKDCGFVAPF